MNINNRINRLANRFFLKANYKSNEVLNWMVTIRDVAKKAGVSVATVSAVINKNKFVSEELTKRVEEAIHIMNYKPNKIAQGLAKQKSYVFAYLVPSISNPIFARTVEGMEEVIVKHDYTITIVNTSLRIEKYRHDIRRLMGRVDGIAITASHHPEIEGIIKEVQLAGIPIVVIHSPTNLDICKSILFDDVGAINMAVNYLLGKGHRKIGFVGIKNSTTCKRRWQGYKKGLEEAGIFNPNLSIFATPNANNDGQYNIRKEIEQVGKILYKELKATAVIASSDSVAIDIINYCHNKKIKVPQEISIVGFDDTLSSYTWPSLTSIRIPYEEMGRVAGEYLLRENNVKYKFTTDANLKPELIIRNST